MPDEFLSEKVLGFALVPAQQRTGRRYARHRTAGDAAQDEERLVRSAGQVTELELAGTRIPAIGHLHPAAIRDDLANTLGERFGLDRDLLDDRRP